MAIEVRSTSSTVTQVPKQMCAAVLERPFQVSIKELPVPELGSHEVLVKVMAVGVCGSDVHYYEHGRIGDFVVKKPIILGHECAGIVVDVGRQVSRVKVGDRVAIEPGVTCGRCDACKSGRYNLCPEVQFLATPPYDGAFVEYLKHREDFVFPIPDSLSFEEAALVEPLSVGIHACKRAGVQPGSRVAVMGMGPVGLLTVVAAKAFGASEVYVTDLQPIRLEAAKHLGASVAVNVQERDPVEVIREMTDGAGVDVAVETAGNPRALQSALMSLKRGGRLGIVGLPAQDEIGMNVPFISSFEVDIFGVFRYANTYSQGIKFLASGNYDVRSLITDQYPLEKAKDALERARTNKSGSLKVMVYPNGLPANN
ncbi:NAD(P)-dependent alcohol dehydrogenase [Alicyclobacillus shizuokensis]|uniref:NAD(P)-dependent alcohol dehydrogenase n=1 Tax=Alicyclobacillus shizuokensis TaxID=392014 RepID=UPI00082FE93A|nr:NAD(P)-dependent alcohol dehydrogenase [Alicyclobacillus shizuokensis]